MIFFTKDILYWKIFRIRWDELFHLKWCFFTLRGIILCKHVCVKNWTGLKLRNETKTQLELFKYCVLRGVKAVSLVITLRLLSVYVWLLVNHCSLKWCRILYKHFAYYKCCWQSVHNSRNVNFNHCDLLNIVTTF